LPSSPPLRRRDPDRRRLTLDADLGVEFNVNKPICVQLLVDGEPESLRLTVGSSGAAARVRFTFPVLRAFWKRP
jgi:hypothetical protein